MKAVANTLRRLATIAQRVNSLQHAGNPVPPCDWSELYQTTAEAFAVLEDANTPYNFAVMTKSQRRNMLNELTFISGGERPSELLTYIGAWTAVFETELAAHRVALKYSGTKGGAKVKWCPNISKWAAQVGEVRSTQ